MFNVDLKQKFTHKSANFSWKCCECIRNVCSPHGTMKNKMQKKNFEDAVGNQRKLMLNHSSDCFSLVLQKFWQRNTLTWQHCFFGAITVCCFFWKLSFTPILPWDLQIGAPMKNIRYVKCFWLVPSGRCKTEFPLKLLHSSNFENLENHPPPNWEKAASECSWAHTAVSIFSASLFPFQKPLKTAFFYPQPVKKNANLQFF